MIKSAFNFNFKKYLAWLTIAVSCISINEWSSVPIGNGVSTWAINYLYILIMFLFVIKKRRLLWTRDYVFCSIYLVWTIINVLRGTFIADNKAEYHYLLTGTAMCSIPLFAFMYRDPNSDAYILRKWNKWMFILFLLFFMWVGGTATYFYLLPFVLLYLCFFRHLPLKVKIVIVIMAILFCVNVSNRSNVIKVFISVLMCLLVYMRSFISTLSLRVMHWIIYISAIFLVILGITGRFNVLEDFMNKNEGKYEYKKEDLSVDSRSLIYIEVINSAIKNNYMWFGRTPARGNDTNVYSFYADIYKNKYKIKNVRYERHFNELALLNIFTWLGIIGLVLYSLIYLRASYMAVYHSNSFYLKLIGLCVAFHWAYGWIEDINTFTVQNMWIWMMIAMGLSSRFRTMTDRKFIHWIKSIFN